jgi:hypothetical protein
MWVERLPQMTLTWNPADSKKRGRHKKTSFYLVLEDTNKLLLDEK